MNLRTVMVTALCALTLGACNGDTVEAPPNITFDGERALGYARLQVDAGPRVPGSESHRLVGDRIIEEMRKNADTVIVQAWSHTAAKGESLPLRNIFAQFNRAATKRILYVTHYDSRPNADKSFSTEDRAKPVPGANDGASGTAMLLVLAEMLKSTPPAVGVDFLFTDGEDYGDFGPPEVDVLLGAKYFAEHLLPDANYRPMFGVLWDMVGDRNLEFKKETYSLEKAPEVVDRVWTMAAALGYSLYFVPTLQTTVDDHIPLLAKGLPVIDVIDLDFAPHHTTQDTMDKVSAQSLEITGRVALALIRAEKD